MRQNEGGVRAGGRGRVSSRAFMPCMLAAAACGDPSRADTGCSKPQLRAPRPRRAYAAPAFPCCKHCLTCSPRRLCARQEGAHTVAGALGAEVPREGSNERASRRGGRIWVRRALGEGAARCGSRQQGGGAQRLSVLACHPAWRAAARPSANPPTCPAAGAAAPALASQTCLPPWDPCH
jgi:hypothetical protein